MRVQGLKRNTYTIIVGEKNLCEGEGNTLAEVVDCYQKKWDSPLPSLGQAVPDGLVRKELISDCCKSVVKKNFVVILGGYF